MDIQTTQVRRCIETMESSLGLYESEPDGTVHQEVFRNAVVKGFELTLETSVRLLRRALKEYGVSGRTLDSLPFKDVLRLAGTHGLMEIDEVERWFAYRDNRNSTAHDYGVSFARETLGLVHAFVADARRLADRLDRIPGQGSS